MKNYYFSNKKIAKILNDVAAAYTISDENRFKIIAYQNAASSIEHATSEIKDLWEEGKLDTLPGLGENIRKHLNELFTTGKVKHFEAVTKDIPQIVFELLKLRGMGPKTAYKLATSLKLKSLKDLAQKAKSKKIRKIPGFGQKSEQEILESANKFKEPTRYLLSESFPVAERILNSLKTLKEVEIAEPLGSLRRMNPTVGDIDIAVASKSPQAVIKHFAAFGEVSKVLEAGERKGSVILKNGMQIDLLINPPKSFGSLLQHFTGSKNHNIKLREFAIKNKTSVSDYGIRYKGRLHEFKTEEEFYNFLGMDWIVPEMREDTGEIEAALKHKLPKVVELGDIKGDIHLHSNYPIEPSHDLGKDSFEDIINKAKSLEYEYVGLSDHSPGYSTHSKYQIIKLIEKRSKKIEQLKSSIKNIGILNLLEIDILTNGQLSVPKEGLKLLNGAIAGIHSSHSQGKSAITQRLLVAIRSPYVQVISHPTGRLLNARESYEADWPLIFRECRKTRTMLEINAHPNRMDLTDTLARAALEYGVKFIINTDSHDITQMDNMRFGVAGARRGWAQKGDIANTLSWVEFRKLFNV